ncbi:cysteine protease [Brevundimonas sp. Root1279]|uniref:cysteine protease n=1 Tax=Brevundimonas sp. Root1279 TaxID=1736443 RepID=UPI0009EC5DD6|nr:cysteine protease [Brevundimonas sp. Root1279]
MPVPRFGTILGGMLLSPAGRRFAGRHAGKLALATLAFQLWESRRGGRPTGPKPAEAHPRKRWSGRRR